MGKTPVYIGTNLTVERPCPVCHAKLDGLTCLALDQSGMTNMMKLGDVTLCAYCGSMLTLTEFGFQVASVDDVDRVPEILQRVLASFDQAKRRTH